MKLISFSKIIKEKPKKKTKTPEDKLTKLWFDIQKKKRRNKALVPEIQRMLNVYHKEIEKVSLDRFTILHAFVERILFLGKEIKFTSNQHTIYQQVVQYHLVEGLHSPFAKTLKFDQLIADFQMVSENSSSKNTKSQKRKEANDFVQKQLFLMSKLEDVERFFTKEEWESMVEDTTLIQTLFDEKVAPFLLKKQQEKLRAKAEENFEVKEKTQINFTSVHALYKKLAKKFHPDLSVDEKEKEERHSLMSVITEAKNKDDISTLLDLYSLHFKDEKITFKVEETEKLITLFEKQLEDLEEEKDEIIGGPKEQYIYQLFVGKSGSGIDREANNIVVSEMNKAQQISTLLDQLHTDEDLKKLLMH